MQKEQDYVQKTFNEVANEYDQIPFFKTSAVHVAQMILEHTKLRKLEVLDIACGTGNVVLECASRIPEAHFDAMDISEGMLAKAKENATKKKLNNIDFHVQDITKLDLNKKYHVITCGYSLFLLPDVVAVLKNLLEQLRPMGFIIFTTFTEEAFSPSSEIILSLLEKYASPSALKYDRNKWQNLKYERDIKRLCTVALVNDMNMHTEAIRYGMNIDAWWALHNNTEIKGMLMELSKEDYASVKNEYYEAMSKHVDMKEEVELIADTHFVLVS